ncbi:hypothetical protein M1C57_14475 [Rhodococcus pyridinivorans]|uniref:hypothetical protein n=1 Tax=Rhodococcus pyridinivorans TaxID=103816 RepID=UPI00200ABF20|nr:hypothetical protein [Rhodococcus pyridinivorans]UPW02903.1 hypothetical protein M1C57_14475 [Rhodococcus pyridinivorans]
MPTFHDPLADAAEASEALRGLAHASRVFDDPADTYTVFGDLTATMRSLRQVLDQLAATHLAHRNRAHHDDGDHLAGDRSALAAADELHQAGTLLDQAQDHLDAAFSHSGRIAWHPTPVQTSLHHDSASAAKTVSAGALRLTVWPDAPVGEHQRYAYRITDTTTGQELEGRDLFTGAGQPVDPDRAIRDLAIFLTAAGEARQYALDNPDSEPEHAGLFPEWVAEGARTNADALTELTELTEPVDHTTEPVALESAGSEQARRWVSVVFLQGEEADQVLDVIDRDGTTAAIEHLAGYDYGEETTQAAMENGYVYDGPPTGALDRVVTGEDGYTLTYNPFAGHVSLLREHHAPPADALKDPAVVAAREAIGGIGTPTPEPAAKQQAEPVRSRRVPDPSWFEHPGVAAVKQSRGLSL